MNNELVARCYIVLSSTFLSGIEYCSGECSVADKFCCYHAEMAATTLR